MQEPRRRLITEVEVRRALNDAAGSATRAAVILGVHRVTVYKLMRRFGIEIRREVA